MTPSRLADHRHALATRKLSRRGFVAAFGATLIVAPTRSLFAAGPMITVTKDPSCSCCEAWADHLKANGFAVKIIEDAQINRVKARLGVPSDLYSCHTAEIDGYVIEGHVPAGAIRRLLAQRPNAKGLSAPGMPVGSPGMEVPGSAPEVYSVMIFGPDGTKVYARYKGADEVPAS
jgi:hypothetical protein